MTWVFFVSFVLFLTAVASAIGGGPIWLTIAASLLLVGVLGLGVFLRARERHFARETWGQAARGAVADGFRFLVSWL